MKSTSSSCIFKYDINKWPFDVMTVFIKTLYTVYQGDQVL